MVAGVTAGAETAALLRGAWTALRGGEPQQARALCEQVLLNDPANFDAWRMLAIARRGRGDDAGTGQALDRAHALRPGDVGAACDLGTWLLEHDQATVYLDAASAALLPPAVLDRLSR